MSRSAICALLVALSPIALHAAEPSEWAKQQTDELVKLYRQFHQAPELSFHEEQTAKRVAEELKPAGLEITSGIGGHGLVGLLKNGEGPTVMIRTDLDALPVTEVTQLAYASQVKVKDDAGDDVGVMHACGHDVHITCLIGVARYLAANKDRWSGTAMFIGQPAEERGSGAKAMLNDGLFTKFKKPDYALALHVDAELPTGQLGYRAGYALANTDSIDVTMKGKGGHGAYPHTTIDPVVLAAHLVIDLQTVVSREIAPIDPAVITVGSIHGGTKHNIIGDSCHLQITVRSYKDEVRKHLQEAIKRKALAVAAGANAPEPEIKVSEGTPAMFNNEELVARVVPVFEKQFGKQNVIPAEPSMGGEDFSQYGLAGVPIFMFRLGAVDAQRLKRFEMLGQNPPSLHSPLFYPDAEKAIETGVTAMSVAALELLAPKK